MLRLKFGNHKLPDDTAIFNMGTAKECPSRKLGLCATINEGIKCYAEKPEDQYPNTVPAYRRHQEEYWKSTSQEQISSDIVKKIQARRKTTRFLRFNESGDFFNQECVTKLSYVARAVRLLCNVTTYGYTARSDLDFKTASFLIKGSCNNSGNNGRCIVINKNQEVPPGYLECPGSCKRCNLCKINVPHNIAFRKH